MAVSATCSPATEPVPPVPLGGQRVVIASFNFTESRLLAEIYAAALQEAGIAVRRELDLGPRELVAPALAQGHVDVVPEYLGTALAFTDPRPGGAPSTTEDAHAALRAALDGGPLMALAPAAAQNQNVVVVPRQLAERLQLETIRDLADHAPSMTIAGPPECPIRRYCLGGLVDVYGLTFGRFVPLDGASRVARAFADDVADVGVMFATDGQLATRDLVVLGDDRHLQPPENIVPIVRRETVARHGERLRSTLDAVSARLTTTSLRLLNWRVSVSGRDPRREALAWLTRQGMVTR